MGVMLDLSAYRDETGDIRMEDGTVLHLKKPSELMVIRMMRLKDLDENSDPLMVLASLNATAREVLNNNADGISFSLEAVTELRTDTKLRIVKAYTEWAVQLQSNPTTPPPASPDRAATKPGKLRGWLTRWRNTRG